MKMCEFFYEVWVLPVGSSCGLARLVVVQPRGHRCPWFRFVFERLAASLGQSPFLRLSPCVTLHPGFHAWPSPARPHCTPLNHSWSIMILFKTKTLMSMLSMGGLIFQILGICPITLFCWGFHFHLLHLHLFEFPQQSMLQIEHLDKCTFVQIFQPPPH